MSISNLLFSFEGRIPRAKWWGYYVPLVFVWMCLFLAVTGKSWDQPESWEPGGVLERVVVAAIAYGLVTLYPTLAVNVKRCHDLGGSGWLVLALFVPIVNFYYLIRVSLFRGTGAQINTVLTPFNRRLSAGM